MRAQIKTALGAFALLTLLTGVIYPLLITGIGQLLMPFQANGSLITQNGVVVGSALIGQGNSDSKYFWSRPSAINYGQGSEAIIASGATNYGWTSVILAKQVTDRAAESRSANGLSADSPIPPDLLFASASGLDPHISPDAASLQVARVAKARGLDSARVQALVDQYTEGPQFGILGQPRVNVLRLNLALDNLR